MKTMKCGSIAFPFFLILCTQLPAWAQVAFNTSSQSTILRHEGLTEAVGGVRLRVANPGPNATIVARTAISAFYSVPISVSATTAINNIQCIVGGVTGCPGNVAAQISGSFLTISFSGPVTLTTSGDGFTFLPVRVDATSLNANTQIQVQLTGNSPASNSVTYDHNTLPVGVVMASFGPAALGQPIPTTMYTCNPEGNTARSFSFTVTEGIASTFSTQAQEAALIASPAPSNGTIIQVVFSNVPAGVTITPVGSNGSDATIGLITPPPQTSTGAGSPMTFSWAFSATSQGAIETAQLNFNAGFSSALDISTIQGTISANVSIGPVGVSGAANPTVVSFQNNPLVTAAPFAVAACQLFASPTGTERFSLVAGTGPSAQQGVSVSEVSGASGLTIAAVPSTTDGANWLIVSPSMTTEPAFISLSVDATNLKPGNYTGKVVVSTLGATSVTIPAQLTVTPSTPMISLSNSSLTFTYILGSANPANQAVTVSNLGGGNFSWTTVATTTNGGSSWLSATPASGSGTGAIVVSVNAAGLVAGTYTGQVQVASAGATNTPQNIAVTLVVSTAPVISLSPSGTISFVTMPGVSPLSQMVAVTNTGGGGSIGLNVTPATQTGGNWLTVSPGVGTTPLTLTVSASAGSLAAGVYQGTITVTAGASSGTSNNPFTINVTLSIGTPVINTGGVVGAAGYVNGASVAPGSIASLFGIRLAGTTVSAPGLPLPTALAGTQVFVNGSTTGAPLFSVSPTQINFEMPVEATSTTASVVVVSNGLASPAVTIPGGVAVPGVFTANSQGTGQAAANNADGSANSATNPAAAGSLISLFVTGLGPVNPAVVTGQAGASAEPLNRTVTPPTVLVNAVSATVQYAGLAPNFVGLYQVNVTIPQGTASGPATVLVVMPAAPSNPVTIAVK